jgi:DNA-binding GntR family transcriptional regulator
MTVAGRAPRTRAKKATTISTDATPSAAVSKSELAYNMIRERIANGTYASGYRLVLDQLAQDLSISPVPVREAIRRLEAEGYVVFKRNVGAQVASIDITEYEQMMQVLAVLEAAATALSMPYLTKEDLAEARKVNEAMKASLAAFDPVEFTRLNRKFHGIVHAPCPNHHLKEFITREWKRMDAIRRSTFSFVPERARDAVKEHDRLLKLLEAKTDPAEVERFFRGHLNATAEALHAWHESHRPPPQGDKGY